MTAGNGYWRIMPDLNPSIPNEADRQRFADALKAAAPEQFGEAAAQGDHYFYIPVLGRHRGVAHFYLEGYNTGDFPADLALAKRVGEAAIDAYDGILGDAVRGAGEPTEAQRAAQLAYHTLYFFQVLTLDRGTTTGLMVHNQNDVGILGSLPPRIDKNLLASWQPRMPEPQDRLLGKLLSALPNAGVCTIDEAAKRKLADAVRTHYRLFPGALTLQASGNTTPPTVENHR
jgi:coproporphyrinogen III oxidase